jgi:hypothetical protein
MLFSLVAWFESKVPLQQRPWASSARNPGAEVRVDRALPEHGLGWFRTRTPACSAHGRPPLMNLGLAPSVHVRRGLSTGFSLNGFSDRRLGRIRTFDRLLAKLLYPTELHNSGGHPGVEPGTRGANHLMAHIGCFQRRGMCSTDRRTRVPRTGGAGVNPNP